MTKILKKTNGSSIYSLEILLENPLYKIYIKITNKNVLMLEKNTYLITYDETRKLHNFHKLSLKR